MAPPTPTSSIASCDHSADPKRKEADVYDRQIRLWGADAQAKISESQVLYIHVTGLTSEVLKNLVLAGVRASICDGRSFPTSVNETPSFFWTSSDQVQNTDKSVAQIVAAKVEELNPLLGSCGISETDVTELDSAYLKQFSVVVASRISPTEAIRIADIVTQAGHVFYMADCFGLQGAVALDLGSQRTYRPELGKKLLEITTLEPHVPMSTLLRVPLSESTSRFHKTPPSTWIKYKCILHFFEKTGEWPSHETAKAFCNTISSWILATSPCLSDHPALDAASLEALACTAIAEVAPVCSVLGGIIGNEIIKILSGKGEPSNNAIFFDGLKVWNFLVKPKT